MMDVKANSRLFPLWIMKNFKDYSLDEIFFSEDEDPCNVEIKLALAKYQEFVGAYLGSNDFKDILIYHGLGSGKTATAVNVYNVLYNKDENWNVVLLIKASLKDDPWMKDLGVWLDSKNKERMMHGIHFVNYDAHNADKTFLDTMKKVDASKKTMFVFDEVHNFISNVYNNLSSASKKAKNIYDYIINEKRNSNDYRVVCISATPIVNNPYELGLLFNLLRPDIFPNNEVLFNQKYINQTTNTMLPSSRNSFMRYILGLVSYYVGATPDKFAQQYTSIIDLEMSAYHTKVYQFYEDIEESLKKKYRSESYRSYTRQACNFVFPEISDKINGYDRPRPSKFRATITDNEEEMDDLYKASLDEYTTAYRKYLQDAYDGDKDKTTINDDLEDYKKYVMKRNKDKKRFLVEDAFPRWIKKSKATPKSGFFTALYKTSPKSVAAVFNFKFSNGPIQFYSGYVRMEGLEMFKIVLDFFGYNAYDENNGSTGDKYCEFTGDVDRFDKNRLLEIFRSKENVFGGVIKLILISPSGTEGINLNHVRQVHVFDNYWNENRILQLIGRSNRQCSHKYIDRDNRYLEVFRYEVSKNKTALEAIRKEVKEYNSSENVKIKKNENIHDITSDIYIRTLAMKKSNLNESFLTLLKQSAVDCHLFQKHNMLTQNYHCFQFSENVLFNKNPGPAYSSHAKDNIKLDDGLMSENSIVKTIRVREIYVQIQMGTELTPKQKAWYYSESGVVYDYDLHYPIGKVAKEGDIPIRISEDIYLISDTIL